MVLQAVVADAQLLLSLPVVPFTYHVLAEATEEIISTNNVTVRDVFVMDVLRRRANRTGPTGLQVRGRIWRRNWAGILLLSAVVVNAKEKVCR